MKNFCVKAIHTLEMLRWFPLLLFRLVLAFGFFGPAMMKLSNFDNIVAWFTQMNIPFPTISAYLLTFTETAGVILLTLGLFTRLISLPLMFAMFVAIAKVHWVHGFQATNNGFEIPLYYLVMLFGLFILGPGKISIDALIKRGMEKKPPQSLV